MTAGRQLKSEQIKTGALQDAIFNSAYFSSIATDEHGVIQIFNVGAERMLGYAAIDVVNRITPADISDPQELITRAATLSAELETPITPGFEALVFKASRGIEDIYELTYVRKNGSRFPAMVSVTALRDGEDRIIGYLLIGTDNTARKEVEAAQALLDQRLRDQQFYTRSLIESNIDALMMTDPDGNISDVNQQMMALTGRTREELIGTPCRNFFTDPSSADEAIGRVITEDKVSDYELTVLSGSGVETVVSYNAATFHDRDGRLGGVFASARDMTDRKRIERSLQRLAHFDALTGLPNRTVFYDTLKQSLLIGSPRGWDTAVLFIDIDHFKNVNDTLGHAVGDELLIQVSQRLIRCLRGGDTVGRLGGDEFAVILLMEDGAKGAALIAAKIQDALREPFQLHGHELTVTASIGITVHPDDADEPEILIKYADTAMYQAKRAGRDTIRFFTTQMNVDALARLELEIALRRAVKNGEFVLHYQPKARLEDGTIAGLEALLRWERPGHGLVPPGAFIPALEESGLIVDVGSWVIDAVCQQIDSWRRSAVGLVHVSLNVAGRQFMDGDLEGDVSRALEAHDVPAHLLELELTESTLMVNTDRTIATLGNLRAKGVRISIDDFGTGYSSLAYLRRFPIDKLKIDISFIREITTNTDDAAISLAIIQLAHSLNMDVIAEGVETEAQLSYLQRHRCDQIQGYYFRKPLTVHAVAELLLGGEGLPARASNEPSNATLLLVDDDPHVIIALQMLLGDDGYRILTATSALEGFDMLALHEVQVILCDERMPDMTGTNFLARVKEMHPEALRILLSSGADEEALIASINRGEVYRYYTKPWNAAELRSNLSEAFRHYWKLQDARTARWTARVLRGAT